MPGTLFVVATPIGNLEDLTGRAARTLREVDLIAAEDTRRTAKLLARYDIQKPIVSLREHNEVRETARLLDLIAAGRSVALVSDAGTPGIADPGAHLITAAHGRGLPVVPIPGPSAVTAALSVSGYPADQFVFLGFPPSSGSARTSWLAALAKEVRTTVFFEAPHRIHRTLEEVANSVKRPIIVIRELSKINEELVLLPYSATSADIAKIRPQGEFAIVVSPAAESGGLRPADAAISEAAALVERLTKHGEFSELEAAELAAAKTGVQPKQILKYIKKLRILAKQQNRAGS